MNKKIVIGWCLLIAAFAAPLSRAMALNERPDCRIHYPAGASAGLRGDGALVPSVPTVGTNTLLYIPMRFADEKADPALPEDIERELAQANALFKNISYGQFALKYTVTPVLTFPQPRAYYEEDSVRGFERILEDARAAAAAAGYNFSEFDFDVTLHTQIGGRPGGEGNLGSRGARVSTPAADVLVHELGHNFGLSHAQFWRTTGPSLGPVISPPFPQNSTGGRDEVFDGDSIIGHESMVGPGRAEDYGDNSDIMGSGRLQFNAVYKHQVGWLADSGIHRVTTNGIYRIYPFDVASTKPGIQYAIRVEEAYSRSPGSRQYWVQHRTNTEEQAFLENAVQIHWGDVLPSRQSSLLLDTTPGTIFERQDSALALGRTFTDEFAGLHITPIEKGEDANGVWMDVAVHFDPFLTNVPPTISVTADKLEVAVNEPVTFSAQAADSEGDHLSVRWEFGDLTSIAGTNIVRNSWRREGEFVVRCEVSDLKGGRASRNLIVKVGSPKTGRITGRVTDPSGKAVAGVRVHNGYVHGQGGKPYVYSFTDSEGFYALTGLTAGLYTNNAFLFGHRTMPHQFTPPVTVSEQGTTEANFIVESLPRISVSADPVVDESGERSTQFTFTRTGPTNAASRVIFSLSGTALPRSDFIGYFSQTVVIPAGATSTTLPLTVVNDQVPEGPETLKIAVEMPSLSKRLEGTPDEYTVYYPGWERKTVAGEQVWAQTSPDYLPASTGSTSVLILDDDAAHDQIVSLSPPEGYIIEEPKTENAFRVYRVGDTGRPLSIAYSLGGTAQNGADYEKLSGTVVIPAGEDFALIPIVPIADKQAEGNETIILTLEKSPDYAIESGSATGTIKDDTSFPVTLLFQGFDSGSVQLQLNGQPGRVHVVEQSTDLKTWTGVKTNILFTESWHLSVPVHTNALQFFRGSKQ